MDTGIARLGRATGAALLSTLSALTLHVIAGGHTPAAAAVLVPLGASFAVAVQLSGRPLGRVRLALIAIASQLAFHALFSLGSGAAPTVTGTGHGHHGAGLEVVPGAAGAHAASMPLAHVAAAIVTYAGARHASALTAALASAIALAAAALRARLAPRVRTHPRLRPVVIAPAPAARTTAAHLRSHPLRGPPAVA